MNAKIIEGLKAVREELTLFLKVMQMSSLLRLFPLLRRTR